jgi:CHAT domain-containing protein
MSGVRLADGWLRAVDFHSLDLRGSLVVLSGCETGVAHVGAGGEVEGLVRGVLSSGAADLVVSLWRVDDAATATLMARFHEELAGGARADAALASAQREALGAGLSPWFWSGFGLWTRRLPRPR